jgi:hypothetical protein
MRRAVGVNTGKETTMKLKYMSTVAGLTMAAVLVALTLSPNSALAGESASARNGKVHLTKDCSVYTGAAGDHCTITASDLEQITIGSKFFYDQAAGNPTGLLDSNVVLDGGSGNRAVGRCTLDLGTGLGLCTFSEGTGRFIGFHARLDVTCGAGSSCRVDGTYGFSPEPDRNDK